MKNRKFRFGTLLAFLAAMTFALNSCEYTVTVDFEIAHSDNDALEMTGWSGTNEVCYTSPYQCNSDSLLDNELVDKTTISSLSTGGGPSTTITDEQAFAKLMSDFDSVKIFRRSDGASTIIYRHDENATEEQRYFFTREAWKCDPEGETEKDRIYTLILTEEMFR